VFVTSQESIYLIQPNSKASVAAYQQRSVRTASIRRSRGASGKPGGQVPVFRSRAAAAGGTRAPPPPGPAELGVCRPVLGREVSLSRRPSQPCLRGPAASGAQRHGAASTGMSPARGCPRDRGAHQHRAVPSTGGVPSTGVPPAQGCPQYRGVPRTGVPPARGCPQHGGASSTGAAATGLLDTAGPPDSNGETAPTLEVCPLF